jgi:hypothetical protein
MDRNFFHGGLAAKWMRDSVEQEAIMKFLTPGISRFDL